MKDVKCMILEPTGTRYLNITVYHTKLKLGSRRVNRLVSMWSKAHINLRKP